jgi:hypothetical protein
MMGRGDRSDKKKGPNKKIEGIRKRKMQKKLCSRKEEGAKN